MIVQLSMIDRISLKFPFPMIFNFDSTFLLLLFFLSSSLTNISKEKKRREERREERKEKKRGKKRGEGKEKRGKKRREERREERRGGLEISRNIFGVAARESDSDKSQSPGECKSCIRRDECTGAGSASR